MSDATESENHATLSKRERQILVCAAHGLTDLAIAAKLGISSTTVGTYWGRIRGKFGHHSRTELVANYMREKAARTMGEMKQENERLVADLAARTKTADSNKSTLDLLRKVLGTAPDAIFLINENGIVEYANEEAERIFGYERNELVQKSVAILIPERFHGTHRNHRKRYLENPVKRPMGDHFGTPALRKDGTEFITATTLNAIQTSNGQIVTAFIREVTESSENQ